MSTLALVPNNRTCYKCSIEKPMAEFYRAKKGFRYECKSCSKKHATSWGKNNKSRINKKHREKYKSDPRWGKNRHLKVQYGINIDQYEKMLVDQNFSCSICNIHQSELKFSMAVDHDHKTGEVRSLLCSPCNTLLGLAKENIDVLLKSIEYIKKFKK